MLLLITVWILVSYIHFSCAFYSFNEFKTENLEIAVSPTILRIYCGDIRLSTPISHGNFCETLSETFENYTDVVGLIDKCYQSKSKCVKYPKNIDNNYNKNDFIKLTEQTFFNSSELENLNITFHNENTKLVLESGFLKHLPHLKHLTLCNTNLHDIKELISDLRSYTKLISFNASGNLLTSVDNFGILDHLEILDLSFNRIKSITKFPSGPQLKVLSLKGNRIINLPQIDGGDSSLIYLDLSWNKIDSVNLAAGIPTNGIHKIDLSNNNISKIEWFRAHSTTRFNNGSTEIILENNDLMCDCTKHRISKITDFNVTKATYSIVMNEQGTFCHWNDKSSTKNNLLDVESTCALKHIYGNNKICDYFIGRTGLDDVLIVNCSFRNLTTFPKLEEIKVDDGSNLPLEIVLMLNGNRFISVSNEDLTEAGYENVTQLNLAGNEISQVQDVLPNLKLLDLSNNRLTTLNKQFMDSVEASSNLKGVVLKNNTWECDCNLEHLRNHLINHTNFKINQTDVYCNRNKQFLVYLRLCGEGSFYARVFYPVATFTIFVVVTVSASIYCKYKTHIKIFLYSKNLCMFWVAEEDIDKDKTYDVFISYSYKDEDFVRDQLLPEIEKPEIPFKACIHYRDWLPGEYISKQITKSVMNSRRTLVVLSNNFMESEWSKMEFRTAHTQAISENKIRVIVVIYGDLDVDSLDTEMKAYLITNTYVKWGDPWFWKKLRYALPHSKRKPNFRVKGELPKNEKSKWLNIVKLNHICNNPKQISFNEIHEENNEDKPTVCS